MAVLRKEVFNAFSPFRDELLAGYREKIHSIHITGSALTDDFDPKFSDINSVLVLNHMDLEFLEQLAPLGIKHGRKRLAAPLIMTPEYIRNSLDVFPIEFLDIKLLHHLVYGEPLFDRIEIERSHLRNQCERELKVKLIGLRQGYLSSKGERKVLSEHFVDTISGYIPLFRGLIYLMGSPPPTRHVEVVETLAEVSGVDTGVFKEVLRKKKERGRPSIERLKTIFEEYYRTVEKLMEIADGIRD
jgi:hypothetical protein